MPVSRSRSLLLDRMSVRQQIAVLTGLLCIVTVMAAVSGAAFFARRDAIQRANVELASVAQGMAERLDQTMFERYREIQNIANLKPLSATWLDDPDVTRGILNQLQSTLSDYAWIGFATTDGRVRAATRGMLEGASVAERPWFKSGIQRPSVEDVHDAKLLDKLLRTSPDEAPFRFVDVAIPVSVDQGIVGVVGAHLSWTWADDVRRKVLGGANPAGASEIWILGKDGNVLLGPDIGQRFDEAHLASARAGQAVTFADLFSATPMQMALVSTKGLGDYPGLGWIVAARLPVDVALAPARRITAIIASLGGMVAITGVLLAWFLARRVTKPLTELCRTIDLIGRDERVLTVERQHGSREVRQLSGAVRSLLRRLSVARALSETDPLTGILNRRAFSRFAEDAMDYYKRYTRGVAILMLDIDHFKSINDRYGHAVGDEVIRSVAKIIAGQVRSTDKVARFGGEEFVVLLREADEVGAAQLAERIRRDVENSYVQSGDNQVSLTISVGGAFATPQDRDIEDVIARADAELYRAKTEGRNRVSIPQRSSA